MTKKRKRLDTNDQMSLFDVIRGLQDTKSSELSAGCMDIDRRFREALSEALKRCPLSRWQVAARMSELTGCDITKAQLDSWTSESKEFHRFPAIYLPAFCEATGDTTPLKLLANPVGVFVLPGPEALRAEIQRIDEDISRKQSEKKKRMMFLKEMEGRS